MAGDAFDKVVEAGQAGRNPTADPLERRQWYLGESAAGEGAGIDVRPVWRDYTGAGVTVGIWDDGVDYGHADLDGNYDADLHIPIGAARHDPAPQDTLSRHGTSVAGVIAAERDGRGTVGIAYGATIAAVDIFYDPDLGFLRSFQSLGGFAVTNHSWTLAAYQANRLDDEWSAFFDGWRDSVVDGRGGLGTINVVAAGNGRLQQRHTNDSNMASIPEVIAVAAVGRDGFVAETSSPGASLLVSAPGEAIWSTDRRGVAGYSDGWNEAGNRRADYTGAFGGTSAATPMVSGVAALMLEANPRLGWRDVQEILALSARHVGSAIGSGTEGFELSVWQVNAAGTWNGGGLHFSNDYGFGLVDARAAVRLAETWVGQKTSANRLELVADEWSGSRAIPDDDAEGIGLVLRSDDAVDLEVVGLRLEIAFGRTSDYEVRLVSPGGTESVLATGGGPGTSATGGWSYASNAFRGETGAGDWQVHVADLNGGEAGTLISAELDFFGAAETTDDVFVLTEEFSDLAGGPHGHGRTIGDTDGGVDTLNAAAVRTASRVDLSAGRGRIDGQAVEIVGIEHVFTGDGRDRLVGDDAANRLDGGRGDDLLRGGGGRDRLVGDAGSDRLFDGRGRDVLFGDAGRDVFVLERDGQTDVVRDFRDGSDRLQLADVGFGDLAIRDLDGEAVRVSYAGERLVVRGLGMFDADDLSASDFLFV